MSEAHTLFVSSTCKYCSLFIKLINDSGITGEFRIVDIHNSPVDMSRIRVIPSIIADHQHLFSGRDAFSWLQNKIKDQIHPVLYSNGKNGFDKMSQLYAYIDDESPQHLTNSNLSCVYSSIEGSSVNQDTNVHNRSTEVSEKHRQLDGAMERLLAEREVGIQRPIERS